MGYGCGGGATKSGGKTTKPGAADVTVSKPGKVAGKTTTGGSAPMACSAAEVGKCGCLDEEDWYTDGDEIYDVVCCEAVGDTYTLYACGDDFQCDDSGPELVCEEL